MRSGIVVHGQKNHSTECGVAVVCLSLAFTIINIMASLLLLLQSVVAALLLLSVVKADTSSHRYKQKEHIELWVNKVRIDKFWARVEFVLSSTYKSHCLCRAA